MPKQQAALPPAYRARSATILHVAVRCARSGADTAGNALGVISSRLRFLVPRAAKHCPCPAHVSGSARGLLEPLMRVSRLRVDSSYCVDRNLPALHLFADVIQDAADLVQGARKARATLMTKPSDVAAARAWIRDGNVGVLSFNEACGWLGWDAERVRRAIFSAARGA
jgi:hypothetical protein